MFSFGAASAHSGSHYCGCSGCHHADKHTTDSHVCGKCGKHGHGARVCGTGRAESSGLPIPRHLQCPCAGCEHKATHTKEGHMCRFCVKYGHSQAECPYRCRVPADVATRLSRACGARGSVYTTVCGEMGSAMIYRCRSGKIDGVCVQGHDYAGVSGRFTAGCTCI